MLFSLFILKGDFMKKYIIIFLLTSIPFYFFGMVKQTEDFKENLKSMLVRLRANFNISERVLSHNTATAIRQIIESASTELDKKKMKKNLKNISQEILEGLRMLRRALEQHKIERQLLREFTQKPKRPKMQQLPSEQRLSVKIQEFVVQALEKV
jgi:hypothetical protein